MHWGRIAGLFLLMVGLAGTSVAARSRRSRTRPNSATGRSSARSSAGGADVNAAQVDGMTALHWAVYNDDAETAGLLVRVARQRERHESLRRGAAVPRLHERQREPREAAARRWRQRERVAPRRGDRPHDGGARGKSRIGESAACPRRQPQREGAARPDGPHVGRGRGARGGRARPHRGRSRDRRQRSSPGSRRCSSPCARVTSRWRVRSSRPA